MHGWLKYQVVSGAMCLLLAGAISSDCTTCVIVVTPAAIVTAIDTKERTLLFNGSYIAVRGKPQKAFLIRSRFAVADVGMEGLTHPSPRGDIQLFNFPTWLRLIEQKLPSDVTVSGLFRVIKDESYRDLEHLGVSAFYNPQVPKNHATNVTRLVQFIVVGYASDVPEVLQLQYKIDWNDWHLVGPIPKILHPAEGARVDRNIVMLGEFNSVAASLSPQSEAHRRLAALIPREISKIVAGDPLTVDEAVRTAGALIRIEAEDNPATVGFPIEVITIPRRGPGKVASYSDKAAALVESHD